MAYNYFGGYQPYGGYNFQTAPIQQPPMQTPIQAPMQPPSPPPPKTNKIFVTSLEEALSRFSEPNSEIVYLHQDQPLLFEIKTDTQGRKVYKTYQLADYAAPQAQGEAKQDLSSYVTREEFEAFKAKIEALNSNGKNDKSETEVKDNA